MIMRLPRRRLPAVFGAGYYHCISRIVEKRFALGEDEKRDFLRLMRIYERLCQVRVLSYCLMDNHFHLLVEVPVRPDVPLSETDLLGLIAQVLGPQRAFEQRQEWRDWREMDTANTGFGELRVQQAISAWHRRMWDLSAFMKALKQQFTQWYNQRYQRKGTLWESRFNSAIVQGGGALGTVGAYIDLNPIRADLVADPRDYEWSSYGAADAGCVVAKAALERLTVLALGEQVYEQEMIQAGDGQELALYRRKLLMCGVASGLRADGKPVRKGMSREKAQQKLDELDGPKAKRRLALPVAELLKCQVRHFSQGVAVGSREFVEEVFETFRQRFGPNRKTGARKLRGTAKEVGLFALRDLGRPKGS